MNDQTQQPAAPSSTISRAFPALRAAAPLGISILLAVFLFQKFSTKLEFGQTSNPAVAASYTVGAVFFSLLVGYFVKLLLSDYSFESPSIKPEENGLRDRLARQVVTIGSLGIAIIGIFLIGAIAWNGKNSDVAQSGLSIFTAILPVFSTWVGTVLAFYFTNESFRQAAESTQGLLRDGNTDESITRPGTMIPYDRIIRVELKAQELTEAGGNAAKAAENKKLKEFRTLFTPPGVVRVVIFDDKKIPVYIIRHEFMPPIPEELDKNDTQTVKDYLNSEINKERALNFSWTGRRATIADCRRLFEIRRVTDVFVTEHGRSDEPVIGWVPDENIRKGTG